MDDLISRLFSNHVAVPFWPDPLCAVDNPVGTCTWLGITVACMEPITWNSQFAAGIEGGHIWTFMVLLVLGIAAMAYVKTPWRWQDSMKITCALYAAETAFFAIFRIYWGLSKPLLVGAALHNLFEWAILLHVVAETTNFASFQRNMYLATFWILTVVAFVIMIPNLLVVFLVEQATGLMLDFGLPLLFASVYFGAASPDVRRFYRWPLVAHTAHIGCTILPLVMATFFVGRVSWYSTFWNEIFIYLSAPVTHVLYIVWSHQVDDIRLGKRTLITPDEQQDDRLLPPQYRIKNAKYFLGIGFLFGLVTLVGVPTWLGVCPGECVTEGPITTTSVAFVNRGQEGRFVTLLQEAELVKTARRTKGNVDYKIVQSVDNPREFRFMETWSSHAAVTAWIQDGLPSRLFHTSEMKHVLRGQLTNLASYKTMGAKCAVTKTGAKSE